MVMAEPVQACDVCGRTVIGGTVRDLRVHYQYECSGAREQEREESTMGPKKRIRWTITGEGVPLENLTSTWKALSEVISEAQEQGLLVEVAEVEVEDR